MDTSYSKDCIFSGNEASVNKSHMQENSFLEGESEILEDSPQCIFVVGSHTLCRSKILDVLRQYSTAHNIELHFFDDLQVASNDVPIISWPREGDDGHTNFSGEMKKSIYVTDNFGGSLFEELKKAGCKVIGPTCVAALTSRSLSLCVCKFLTTYCLSLEKANIVFSGFEQDLRPELSRLTRLAHYMGARVKNKINNTITHLVARNVRSSLYGCAVGLGISVVGVEWLNHCWDRRDDVTHCGTDAEVTKRFHMKPFTGLCIGFHAFAAHELKHMEEIALLNGATITDEKNLSVTHLVVDEAAGSDFYFCERENLWVVTSQWFWRSVQYQITATESSHVMPHFELKKKKSNKDENSPPLSHERPARRSPIVGLFNFRRKSKDKPPTPQLQTFSKRTHAFVEIVVTERNYVQVLNTLIDVFKTPLENALDDRLMGPLMSHEEIKMVFGELPEILKLHLNLLAELEELHYGWDDNLEVGPLFSKYGDGFQRCYTQFINYFEMLKEAINRADCERQRFHAFLKCNISNPRCARQSLTELLIRPVQRLPSVILLLKELQKHTLVELSDHQHLQVAIENIQTVLNNINDSKKIVEEKIQMVEIFNDIDQCPPFVMSAQRHLVMKFEAAEYQDNPRHKTQVVTIFLLSDSIEIAKRRNNGLFRNIGSQTKQGSTQITNRGRTFKHLYYLPFKLIDKIIELPPERSTPTMWRNSFGLRFRVQDDGETMERLFNILGGHAAETRDAVLKLLSKSVACSKCLYDMTMLKRIESSHVFKRPDSPMSSIGRALENLATKASRRMSRAFSINKNDGLPRSISVTSQISTDSYVLSPNMDKSRKSIQNDNISESIHISTSRVVGSALDIKSKDHESRKRRKPLSIFRRSIQSSDIKKQEK